MRSFNTDDNWDRDWDDPWFDDDGNIFLQLGFKLPVFYTFSLEMLFFKTAQNKI